MALSTLAGSWKELSRWTLARESRGWLDGALTAPACQIPGPLQGLTEIAEDSKDFLVGSKDFLVHLFASAAAPSSGACSSSKCCLEADAAPASFAAQAAKPGFAAEGAPADRLRGWLQEVPWADSTSGPLGGLSEIAEDLGVRESHAALWLPVGLSVLTTHSAPAAVVLCGLSIPTKAVYGAVALLTAFGARSMHRREPQEVDRTMQNRCALALCASSGLHFLMAVLGDVPQPLASYAAQPEVVAHFVQDLIVGPMVILNLGHLVGMGPLRMLPCVGLNVLSTCGAIGVAAAHTEFGHMACGLLNVGALACAGVFVWMLPECAASYSHVGRNRCRVAGDLLWFTWTLYPLVQWVGMSGALSVPQELRTLAVIDLVSKMGTCHLMLRCPSAIRCAARHFGAERGAPSEGAEPGAGAQGRLPEPCSEPVPRGEV